MAGDVIKAKNLAKVSAIDFVDQFSKNIDRLKEVLGITRMIKKVSGTVVKTYKVKGKLENGKVAEGAEIPLSSYETEVGEVFELTIDKWRKVTTLEAIEDKGYQQAVVDTDNALMGDVQFGILDAWFAFLVKTSGRTSTAGKGLRGALAKTRAKLRTIMKNYGVKSEDLIYFVNEDDVADYLGDSKNFASMAEEFGVTYVEKFLGVFNLIVSPDVTPGKVFGTPSNNVIMYYADPASSDIAAAFDFETDETGLVGIAHSSKYSNLTTETVVISGLALFAEIESFIVYADITSSDAVSSEGDEPTAQSEDEPAATAPEAVTANSKKADLLAYAAAHDIDTSGCNTNAEIFGAIEKAEASTPEQVTE